MSDDAQGGKRGTDNTHEQLNNFSSKNTPPIQQANPHTPLPDTPTLPLHMDPDQQPP